MTTLKAKIKGCAHSDLFHEIKPYEEFKFSDLDKRNADGGRQFLEVLLLGYVKEDVLAGISAKPDWDLDKLRFTIHLNDVQIIAESFEEMCSEFSGRMLQQREKAVGMDDFEAAVKRQAKTLFENAMQTFNDKAYELSQQLEHITNSAASIVEREWNAPFAYQVTDEMRTSGFNVLANASGQDLNDPKLIEKVYHAMVSKRDEPFNRPTLKLPVADDGVDRSRLAGYVSVRAEVLAEVRAVLDAHGIQYE